MKGPFPATRGSADTARRTASNAKSPPSAPANRPSYSRANVASGVVARMWSRNEPRTRGFSLVGAVRLQ